MAVELDYQVMVVGLGPVGATLAALLGQAGMRVLAIDRATEVYPLPRAGHFDHEVMRVFQQLGIAHDVLEHARPALGYEFRTASGDILLSVLAKDGDLAPSGWATSYMFNQPGLERALRAKLARCPSVDVALATEFRTLEADEHYVTARCATADGERTITAAFLVGCDGARSPVREALGIKLVDFKFDEPWLVIDTVPRSTINLPELSLQICDPARPTTCVPLGPGKHRWEFMLHPGETPDLARDEAFIHKLLEPWNVDVAIERTAVYRFHGRVAQQWQAGRIMIAGDAAHQTPPFAGQGMCAGIRDAANLAWKLAAVLNGKAGAALLESYQIERDPHVRAYIELAIAMGRIVCTLDPEVARQRNQRMLDTNAKGEAAFPVAAVTPFSGPAVLRGAPVAGELFPQPRWHENGEVIRLDDVMGAGPWLIGRRIADREERSDIVALATDAPQLARFRTELENWLDHHQADAVLVRPDRYVFGAGDPQLLVHEWARALTTAGTDSVLARYSSAPIY